MAEESSFSLSSALSQVLKAGTDIGTTLAAAKLAEANAKQTTANVTSDTAAAAAAAAGSRDLTVSNRAALPSWLIPAAIVGGLGVLLLIGLGIARRR